MDSTNTGPGPLGRVFIFRTKYGYEAFPGTYIATKGGEVWFQNLTREIATVTLPPRVFFPEVLTLDDKTPKRTNVDTEAASGVYEYDISLSTNFSAVGNSSPRIIVD